MNLPETIKAIQRMLGIQADGIFGPASALRVLNALCEKDGDDGHTPPLETMVLVSDGSAAQLDERTVKNIGTLDAKARDNFISFALLANATAATFGCSYILIGGNRTWEEQDALYAQGRTMPGDRVTKAKGGQSNHNFGIAGDFGVFRGKSYLDDSNPTLAAKVHQACSVHAEACGLEWGGSWKSIVDQPHYEIRTDLAMVQKRELYQAKGSVL